MKIDYRTLIIAINKLHEQAGLNLNNNHKFEITLIEEDPGEGKLGECIVITVNCVYHASINDKFKTDTIREYTVEIFADSENRPPRITVMENRDLVLK